MGFKSEPALRALPEGHPWKLIESFTYDYYGTIITVPRGFTTDFASVPRIFWNILPPFGKYGNAAIIHDYCYDRQLFPRKQCDLIFYKAMLEKGVPKWKAVTMYKMVRMFGKRAYSKGQ